MGCPEREAFTHKPGPGLKEAEREDLVGVRRTMGLAPAPWQQVTRRQWQYIQLQQGWVSSTHLLRVKRRWWLLLHFHLPNLRQDHVAHANPELCREGNSEKRSSSSAKLTDYKPTAMKWMPCAFCPSPASSQYFWQEDSKSYTEP